MTTDDLYIELSDMCIKKTPFDENIEYVFINKKIDPNIDYGIYFASAHGNLKMLEILKKYGGIFSLNNYESLRISAQNGHLDCVKFILNEYSNVNIEQFKNNLSYENMYICNNQYIKV